MRFFLLYILAIFLILTVFTIAPAMDYSTTCTECHGKGKVTCRTCWGMGGQVDCPKCDGKGRIGNEYCSQCSGTKYVKCPDCHGTAKVTCPKCGGSGKGGPCGTSGR